MRERGRGITIMREFTDELTRPRARRVPRAAGGAIPGRTDVGAVLALDYGTSRIGIAVSDPTRTLATAVAVHRHDGGGASWRLVRRGSTSWWSGCR
jgi:hypothetical protein